MTRTLRGFAASLIMSLLIFAPLIWAADQADASSQVLIAFEGSDFLIPRPEAQAPVGEPRLLTTYDVPDSLVGVTCSFTVTAANGESVHQANYGRLVTNGDQTDILDTENEPFVEATRLTDSRLTLGTTIQLFNIIGGYTDGDNLRAGFVGTSVDYRVEATCTLDDTTTTSSIQTTTSTVPGTSSTSAPPSSTTSTVPPTTTTVPASSTSAPTESTTTTTPDGSTNSTIPPVTSPPTLPFTGVEDHLPGVGLAAAALLMLGAGVLLAGKEGR